MTDKPAAPVTRQYVIFTLDSTDYAIPVDNILEIMRTPEVTPLPSLPEWALGIVHLRGDIVSVVDLRRFLGKPAGDIRAGRLLLVRSLREEIQAGFVVDDVSEVADLPEATELCGGESSEPVAQFARGVLERDEKILVVLDPERLMLSPALRQFETLASS
jgi:purine-binding chemotaxis protein CheW